MANKRSRVITFTAPPQQVFEVAQQVIAEMTRVPAVADGITVRGSMPTTLMSWGEKLEAIVEPDEAGSRITLWSRAAMPLQLVDWGTHNKNLDQLQHGFERLLGAQARIIDRA